MNTEQTTTAQSTTTPAPKARKRAKKVYETTDYAAMMRRMIRAHGRRVADADPEDLTELLALRADLDAAIADAVAGQRSNWGTSWATIGDAAGVTKQAAQQRWGRKS